MNKESEIRSFAIVACHDSKTIYVYRLKNQIMLSDVHLRCFGSDKYLCIKSESNMHENTEHEESCFNKEIFYLDQQSKETIRKISMNAMKAHVEHYCRFIKRDEKEDEEKTERDLKEISEYAIDTTIRDFKELEFCSWYSSDYIMYRNC